MVFIVITLNPQEEGISCKIYSVQEDSGLCNNSHEKHLIIIDVALDMFDHRSWNYLRI